MQIPENDHSPYYYDRETGKTMRILDCLSDADILEELEFPTIPRFRSQYELEAKRRGLPVLPEVPYALEVNFERAMAPVLEALKELEITAQAPVSPVAPTPVNKTTWSDLYEEIRENLSFVLGPVSKKMRLATVGMAVAGSAALVGSGVVQRTVQEISAFDVQSWAQQQTLQQEFGAYLARQNLSLSSDELVETFSSLRLWKNAQGDFYLYPAKKGWKLRVEERSADPTVLTNSVMEFPSLLVTIADPGTRSLEIRVYDDKGKAQGHITVYNQNVM